jgi:hypothetical protein
MSGRHLGQRLTCHTCRKQFSRALGSNRLNCYECRPVRSKVVELKPQGDDDSGSLAAASLRALAEAGVEQSWQAAAVLALAALIDSGRHGAGGAASNIREHRKAMSVALANSDTALDAVDLIFLDDRRTQS